MEDVMFYALPLNANVEIDSDKTFIEIVKKIGTVFTSEEFMDALVNGKTTGLFVKII